MTKGSQHKAGNTGLENPLKVIGTGHGLLQVAYLNRDLVEKEKAGISSPENRPPTVFLTSNGSYYFDALPVSLSYEEAMQLYTPEELAGYY